MQTDKIKTIFAAGLVLLSLTGAFYACKPDTMGSGLGQAPSPDFVAVQGSSPNNFILINKTASPSIPYWTVLSTNQKLKGDSAKVNFVFAGSYKIMLTAAGSGGMDSIVKSVTVTQNDPNA